MTDKTAEETLKQYTDRANRILGKQVSNILSQAMKDYASQQTAAKDKEIAELKVSGGWILSRKKMPEFDGEYLVAGWQYHSCGNVTPFQMVATCKFNQWVKPDIGYQMTYWRDLLPMPSEPNEFSEP